MKKLSSLCFLIISLLNSHAALSDEGKGVFSSEDLRKVKNPFLSKLPVVPEKSVKKEEDSSWSKMGSAKADDTIKKVEEKLPQLSIKGIVWDSERPQAIVNDQVVNPGDKVMGYEILNITKSGIEINFNGRRFTLKP